MRRILAALLLAILIAPAFGQQNTQGTLIPSQASTAATVVSNDMDNPYYHGVTVFVNMSAWTSGTNTCTIQGKDPVSGTYYTILASSALGSATSTALRVFPGITATNNVSASDILPRTWRVSCAGASTPNFTFSVGFMYQL